MKPLLRFCKGIVNLTDNPKPARWLAMLISIAAVLVFRALIPVDSRGIENTDYRYFYEPMARMVMDGSAFDASRPPSRWDLRYPPGFSVICAGIFGLAHACSLPESLLYILFDLLCAALSTALVFELSRRFHSVRKSFGVAMVWCTYPLWLWSLKQPATETPFVPILLASVLMALQLRDGCRNAIVKAFLCGALYGAAMLIRPIAIVLPILGAAIIILPGAVPVVRRRWVLGVIIVATAAVAVTPWELWLHQRTEKFLPLSANGPYSMADGLTFAVSPKHSRQPVSLPPDVVALQTRLRDGIQEPLTARGILASVGREVRRAPVAMVKLGAIKAARSWYGTNSHRRERGILVMQLLYLGLSCLGMAVLYLNRIEKRGEAIFLLTHVAYFWLFTILVLSTARYMVPVMPLLFVFLPGCCMKRPEPRSSAIQ